MTIRLLHRMNPFLGPLRRKSMSAHTTAIGGQAEFLQTIPILRS
jgi:hypothetical protein